MKKRKLKIFWIIIWMCVLVWIVYAADFYRVNHWTTANIQEHSYCAWVINNSTINDYFVPTKTSSEWLSFRSNPPSWVIIDYCYPDFYNVYWDFDLHWSIRTPSDRSEAHPDCWTLGGWFLDVQSPYGESWTEYASLEDAVAETSVIHNWHTIYRAAHYGAYWACSSNGTVATRVWRAIKYH